MEDESKVTSNSKGRQRKGRGGKKFNSSKTSEKSNSSTIKKTPYDDVQIIKDMAQFPLANPLGTVFNTGEAGSESTARMPGIMVLGVETATHIVGYDDPINLAARNVYAFDAHANSRNTPYEANDLMLYIMGTTSLYSMWNHLVRAYGIARQYSAMNRYSPETILQAMGFDPESILNSMNDFRGAINLLASKASTLVIPSSFAYTSECFDLFSNVYADGENSRSQLYVMVPSNYYLYNETKYETGGCLEHKLLAASETRTWQEWVTIINTMLSNLLSSGSVNIMAADIIKAFGDNLYGLFPISEDYTVQPIYDDDVLETIMNSTICPFTIPSDSQYGWDVHQVIPSNPNEGPHLGCYTESAASTDLTVVRDHKYILNTGYESLTPAQVVQRTRFKPVVMPWSDGVVSIYPRTHFFRYARVFTAPYGNSNNAFSLHEDMASNSNLALAVLSNFHHAPLIVLDDTSAHAEYIHGDVENITFISRDDMKKLNDVVTQVLFNVATVYPIK
jgi:hypothetical protein